MNKLCPKCYFLGEGKKPFISKQTIGVLIIMFGLSLYISEPFKDRTILDLISSIISFFMVFGGVEVIVNHYRGDTTCPICDHKPMLNLDDLEAIEILRNKDIKIHNGSK